MPDFEIKKIVGLDNPEIKVKNNYRFPSPENLPKQFFLCGIVGSRGSGKTSTMINIFNYYKKNFDNIYLICPNYENEPKLKQEFNSENEHIFIYTTPNNETLNEIKEHIDEEREKYEQYKEEIKIYEKFMKIKNVELMNDEELYEIQEKIIEGKFPPKSPYHYYPTSLLILDDCVESEIYKPRSPLRNFTIRHRHLFTSIIFITQHYFSLPRILRTNCSWYILFGTRDEKLLKNIYSECSGLFDNFDEFNDIFKYCTENAHEFLYIDTDAKINKIRKNFDKVIIK